MTLKEYQKQVENNIQEFKSKIGNDLKNKFQNNIKKLKLIKTGKLQNSLTIDITEKNKVRIKTDKDYAFPVHFGTQKSGGAVKSFKRKTKNGTTTVKAHHRKPVPPKRFFRLTKAQLSILKEEVNNKLFN